jgi:hypothetical protein
MYETKYYICGINSKEKRVKGSESPQKYTHKNN